MKIIKIESCNDCPYFETELPDMFIEGGHFCNHINLLDTTKICAFGKEIFIEITEWCPLEDV
jgi:hypothetical protein